MTRYRQWKYVFWLLAIASCLFWCACPPPAQLAATLSPTPADYRGGCPGVITFNGTITSDKAQVVTYVFTRSDGATDTIPKTLTFTSAGSKPPLDERCVREPEPEAMRGDARRGLDRDERHDRADPAGEGQGGRLSAHEPNAGRRIEDRKVAARPGRMPEEGHVRQCVIRPGPAERSEDHHGSGAGGQGCLERQLGVGGVLVDRLQRYGHAPAAQIGKAVLAQRVTVTHPPVDPETEPLRNPRAAVGRNDEVDVVVPAGPRRVELRPRRRGPIREHEGAGRRSPGRRRDEERLDPARHRGRDFCGSRRLQVAPLPEDRFDPSLGADRSRHTHVVGRVTDVDRSLRSIADSELAERLQERRGMGLGKGHVVAADPHPQVALEAGGAKLISTTTRSPAVTRPIVKPAASRRSRASPTPGNARASLMRAR